jgi:heme A synthase
VARVAGLVVALIAAQIGLGFANLWFRTPPAIVTAHLTVASWIWTATVALALVVHGRPARLPPTVLEPIH